MIGKYLPVGSVVLLENSKKRVMIIGFKQKQEGTDRIWDYAGCLYPEGLLDPDKLYLFDNGQIDRLYFLGLQDGEGLAFMEKLEKL